MNDAEFVAALPKVELHVHLEGSMWPSTLRALVDKHGLQDFPSDEAGLREWFEFRDFPHFIEVYLKSITTLIDEDDFSRLAYDSITALATHNTRYAEMHVSLFGHLMRGVDASVVFDGIEDGRLRAERDSGVVVRWIPDFPGDFGLDAANRTLDAVLADRRDSVVAFGIGGIEVPREPFGPVFRRAIDAGLHSVPHAGETEGPDRVWSAIRDLGAERIGHGIAVMQDPALVELLREQRIPIDVSPTSNLRTRVVRTVAEHPLPAMIDAGLLVTLNSDDPSMFGTDLTREYRAALEMGLDRRAVATLATNAVDASFIDPELGRSIREEIQQLM
ncbi:aminodeoxyfutalosine deaminase [Rhodococcoides trifolii]|uniref:Aminodeoxyfutalosine deaminase n=1 Tax=Rhodococcoides trifolii TaxID=908250 RepID=A0A917G8Q2_9NOCA|nr:adenosine deaminase [Rhodococcus trifolii]GGG28269.1 aminodeoxyfutalosine deaminase [Rhodococcus trifolii]